MRRTVDDLTLARVLEECLEAMERGETDLDALADRYPEGRPEIRSLLEIAAGLRQRRASYPVPTESLGDLRKRLRIG